MSSISNAVKGYEIVKLKDEEYDAWQLAGRLEEVLQYFASSPVSTPDLNLFNKVINMLWQKRNMKQALTAVREARKKYQGDLNLHEKEAEISLDIANLDDAIRLFRELRKKFPRRYHNLLGLGDALRKKKQFEEAEEVLIEAMNLDTWDPAHLMARFEMSEMLATIYFVKNEHAKAREILESILMLQPRTQKWHLYFSVLKALGEEQLLEEAEITYNRIKMAKRYASRAAKYEDQKKFDLALKNYRKAIEINPFEPHYYFSVGSVLESLPEDEYKFQFDEATGYYKRACEIFPANLFYQMSYIGNLTNVNEWEQAFEQAKDAAGKFPELMLPNLRYLSDVLGVENDYLDLLRSLIDLDPQKELSELRTELAVILKDRRERGYEKWFREAAEIYKQKQELEKYNWRHYYDYACCMQELDEFDEARTYLVKALEYHRDFSVDIAERLVDVEMRLGHYKDARLLLEALVLMHPKDYDYLGKMGLCFLMEEDFEKSFEAFNRSILINRHVPEYFYGAGVSAAHLGLEKDVVAIIKDLLEMNDNFIEVIEDEPAFEQYFKKSTAFTGVMDTSKKKREERIEPIAPPVKPITATGLTKTDETAKKAAKKSQPPGMAGIALKKISIPKKEA